VRWGGRGEGGWICGIGVRMGVVWMDEFRGCEEGWTRDIMAEVCFYARMKTTREKYRDSDILNTTTIPKPHPTHPIP